MKSGAVVANGTDAPVEDVSPLASFYASVSRKLKDGTVFYPDQRMSREEALKSYTFNNAYAAFEEKLKGSLEARQARRHHRPVKRHHDDPRRRDPSTDVVYTIVGGKVRSRCGLKAVRTRDEARGGRQERCKPPVATVGRAQRRQAPAAAKLAGPRAPDCF